MLFRSPELEFRFDRSVEHQDRIEQIIRDLHAEEAARASTTDTATDDAPSPDEPADASDPDDRD